nr:hypothetical protein CFP56_38131 [Quercus suber]
MSERLQNAPMKALDYWVDCSVREIWNAHSERDARVNGTRLFKTLMNEIKTNADTVEKSHLQLAKDMQLDENYHRYDHEALALQREVDAKNVHLNEYEEHLNLDLQRQRQVVSQYEDWLRALRKLRGVPMEVVDHWVELCVEEFRNASYEDDARNRCTSLLENVVISITSNERARAMVNNETEALFPEAQQREQQLESRYQRREQQLEPCYQDRLRRLEQREALFREAYGHEQQRVSQYKNQLRTLEKFQNAPMDDLDYFDVDPWVENCVREMQNSLNEHQARARSRRLLEAFITTYSKLAWSNAESVGSHCENLQGLIEGARMQINNLKQAQEAQLEREKELENRNLEVQYLKQLVPEYQSRLRALEKLQNAAMDSIDDWVERSISEWKTTFNERIARARCRKLIEEIVTYIRDRVRPVLQGQIDTLNREIRNLRREVHGLNQRNGSLKTELEQLREQVSGYQNQQRTLEPPIPRQPQSRPLFCFEAMWLQDLWCADIVQEAWHEGLYKPDGAPITNCHASYRDRLTAGINMNLVTVREWMSTFNERIARAHCRRLTEEIVIFIRDRIGPVINNLRGQVDSLNREIRTLKREVQGLNQQNRSLNSELQQLREQVSEHENRLRTLEKLQNAAMDSINNWVERSVREWMRTFDEEIARANCRRLIEDIMTFIHNRIGPVVNNLEGQVDRLNREIRNLRREVHGLNQQNGSLNSELEQLRRQVSECQNRQRTLEVQED